jgi:hypothetical protein
MSRFTLPVSAFTLGMASLLACGSPYQGTSVPAPAPAASAAPRVLTATCKEYDVRASTMDVITGVSFSLREVTFLIHENTEIAIRDERAELADMRAGMVVRVEYRVTPQGNLADKIDVVLDATGMR